MVCFHTWFLRGDIALKTRYTIPAGKMLNRLLASNCLKALEDLILQNSQMMANPATSSFFVVLTEEA